MRALLNVDGSVILTSFSLPELISPDDEPLLETVSAALARLGLPDEEATAEEPALPVSIITPGVCVPGQQIVHTVAPGETLFQLALIYNTSVAAIRQANNLPGTQMFASQQLAITRGGAVIPTASPPPVDCGPFRATSPLDGLPNGLGTFYWDAATGADDYRVVVTGESGTQVFTVGGSQTNLSANLSVASIGHGFSFTWHVEALRGGAVVCRTPSVTLFREASPPDNPPPADRPANPPPTEEPTPPPETEELTPPATEEIAQPPITTTEEAPPPLAETG
ncbi:MAG: LysM peptidoglycan-binding domain-containing protein [Aggregatilineales bacterium]